MKKKIIGVLFIFLIVGATIMFKDQLTLENIKSQQEILNNHLQNNLIQSIAIYFTIYVLATALSIPGATVITLLGGALFGFWQGLLIISFASTIGATLAFLISRYLLRDWVYNKFEDKLETINKGVEKEGPFYLFSLRLIPIMPFFLINVLFGLTNIKTSHFYIISQIGMLAGTAVYVNAGTQLSKLDSLSGILSFEILASFVLLGLFPFIVKKIMDFRKNKLTDKSLKI